MRPHYLVEPPMKTFSVTSMKPIARNTGTLPISFDTTKPWKTAFPISLIPLEICFLNQMKRMKRMKTLLFAESLSKWVGFSSKTARERGMTPQDLCGQLNNFATVI